MYSHHACGVRALISSDADCCSRILNLNITRGKNRAPLYAHRLYVLAKVRVRLFSRLFFFVKPFSRVYNLYKRSYRAYLKMNQDNMKNCSHVMCKPI